MKDLPKTWVSSKTYLKISCIENFPLSNGKRQHLKRKNFGQDHQGMKVSETMKELKLLELLQDPN